MKLIIDIPEELLSEIDDENYQSIISWYDTSLYYAIKNGTPISDNATNGEVIINIFDAIEIHTMIATVFAVLRDGTELEFKRSWWDESYQKGGKE